MNKFKVGDRVAVYDRKLIDKCRKGKIYHVLDQYLTIELEDGVNIGAIHYKQCRLLKKKEKKQPHEVWVNIYKIPGPYNYCLSAHSSKDAALSSAAEDALGTAVRFVRAKKQK